VPTEEMISLDCPSCHQPLYMPLSWFKQTYGTCPNCGAGVAASQFAAEIAAIEEAFEASIEEMMQPAPGHSGCCGKKSC